MFSFFSRSKANANEFSDSERPRSTTPGLAPTNEPPNTPSPPPPQSNVEISAIHTLISSVPAKVVHQYVLERLKEPPPVPEGGTQNDTTLFHIAEFFRDLTPPKLLHCARCHSNYFAIENTDRSCRIAHDDASAEVSRAEATKSHSYETLWDCCGRTVEGDGDMGPPDGWCYEGTHTMDPRRARFRADSTPYPGDDKLTSCEKMRCAQRGNTTRRRPARKRARVVSYQSNDDEESDDEEEDDKQSAASSKSKSSGRKRRKVSVEPTESTNAMEVDSPSVTSSRPIKGKSKARSRGTAAAAAATAPPVPPLPDNISASPTRPKSILKGKATLHDSAVATSGAEEGEGEGEEALTKKRKPSRKSLAAVEDEDGVGVDGAEEGEEKVKKKRKKKRPAPDADEAVYKDVPNTSADDDDDVEEQEIPEEKKKKRKQSRKSVAQEEGDDGMVVDEDLQAKKKSKSSSSSKKTIDTDEEEPSLEAVKGKKKRKKRLLDVVQSSIPGEQGCGSQW